LLASISYIDIFLLLTINFRKNQEMLAISVSKKQKICPTIQHQILMPMPYVRSHTSSMINDTLPEAERNVQSNKQEA